VFGVAPDCPVPQEDNGSNGRLLPNPNSWVTWRRTQLSGAPIASSLPPTAYWWLRAINTPNHHNSKQPSVLKFSFHTRASAFNPRHNSKDQKPLQVLNSFQSPSDLRESVSVFFCALVTWIAFFLPHSCSQVNCNQSKRHLSSNANPDL
jgi:hypothetical protein